MKRQTYLNIRKTVFMYASVAAMALALPACVKGFKVDVKDSTAGTSQIVTTQTNDNNDNYVVPRFEMTLTGESSMSIIKLVTDADPKAQAILDNPKNANSAIQVTGRFDLSLTQLDSNKNDSGLGSTLRFQAMLLAPEKVELRFESKATEPHLQLISSAGGLPTLKGYWDIRDGPVRTQLYISAVVSRNYVSLSEPYMLDGTMEIMVGGSNLQLGNFSIPLCSVIDSPAAFNIPDLSCAKP